MERAGLVRCLVTLLVGRRRQESGTELSVWVERGPVDVGRRQRLILAFSGQRGPKGANFGARPTAAQKGPSLSY